LLKQRLKEEEEEFPEVHSHSASLIGGYYVRMDWLEVMMIYLMMMTVSVRQ